MANLKLATRNPVQMVGLIAREIKKTDEEKGKEFVRICRKSGSRDAVVKAAKDFGIEVELPEPTAKKA